jgi:DNA-binding MarR family transcriptional regulator
MLLEQYNLSRLIDRMEAEGLVARVPFPGDARRQFVQITAQGRALHKRMWPVYGAAIERHVGCKFSEPETALLAELLARIAAPAAVAEVSERSPPARPRPGSPP